MSLLLGGIRQYSNSRASNGVRGAFISFWGAGSTLGTGSTCGSGSSDVLEARVVLEAQVALESRVALSAPPCNDSRLD